MRAETRNRLWSAMLWTALAAALAGIVATAGAFDASVLLPVMDAAWTPAKLNPVAWWQGEGNATDSAGEYDGVWSGTETYAAGKVGQGFVLDGTNYISAAMSAAQSPSVEMTIAFWGYEPTPNRSNASSVSKYQASPESGWDCLHYSTTARWEFSFRGGSPKGVIYTPSGSPILADTWQHWVFSYNEVSGAIKVWLNGESIVSSTTTTGRLTVVNAALTIGSRGSGNKYVGMLDDVMIFDRVFTSAEASLLYSESVARDGDEW
jgi:hypothetical protein